VRPLRNRIQAAAREQRVPQIVIERDCAQSYVLLGLTDIPSLREALVFKGGTALKKVHFTEYRFSEDLDFSAEGGLAGEDLAAEIDEAIAIAQRAAQDHAPVAFTVERYVEREPHPGGQDAFIVRCCCQRRTGLLPTAMKKRSRSPFAPTPWKRSPRRSCVPPSRQGRRCLNEGGAGPGPATSMTCGTSSGFLRRGWPGPLSAPFCPPSARFVLSRSTTSRTSSTPSLSRQCGRAGRDRSVPLSAICLRSMRCSPSCGQLSTPGCSEAAQAVLEWALGASSRAHGNAAGDLQKKAPANRGSTVAKATLCAGRGEFVGTSEADEEGRAFMPRRGATRPLQKRKRPLFPGALWSGTWGSKPRLQHWQGRQSLRDH